MEKIKNIEKVAQRIKEAMDKKEKIILYSDADMDGTGSAVILKETIEYLKGEVSFVYFPDRSEKGYGLNDEALEFISQMGDKILLIVMDCGIANFDEALTAKRLGIELIIIDHHQPHSRLPEASIIVDPKQEGDNYPFKDFANAGLIFYLAEEMTGDLFFEIRDSLSEIAALSTIADMMKQEDDNKDIIEEGLKNLEKTERAGLRTFWSQGIVNDEMSIREIAQKIVSVFGASGVIDHKTEAYNVLTSDDRKEMEETIKSLNKKNELKQAEVSNMVEEVRQTVSDNDVLVFKGNKNWKVPFLGSAGSKIVAEMKLPVFLYRKGDKTSRGAVRMPQGFNAVDLMSQSSDILIEYGGHPPAAGFKILNENLIEFEQRLKDYFKK
jgi:single-stranded-DNA-specific exonuclease